MLMKNSTFNAILISHQLIAFLVIVFALATGKMAYQLNWQNDLTQNQRNSISDASKKILDGMPESINIKAVASNNPTKGRYFKKSIQSFLARYQHHKKNINLTFLAAERDMDEVRRLGLKHEGDWVVEYNNRKDFFTLPYTEEGFTNLLMKIQSVKSHTFFFTGGHSEPKLNDSNEEGLFQFTKTVYLNGFQLEQSGQLEKLTKDHILVINAPKEAFGQDEIVLVRNHIEQGGNMIWLNNSGNLHGLEPIAESLSIDISDGITVDLSNQALGLEPTLVSASNYAAHEIFKDFSLRSFFSNARRVSNTGNNGNWRYQFLIGVAENGWLTRTVPRTLTSEDLTKNTLKSGPINIAVSMRRAFKEYEQRILILGSSQFISNKFIEQAGNQELAMRLLKWVSVKHSPLSIPQKITKDAVVVIDNENFNRYWIWIIFNGFQFALPILLVIIATLVWYRRSKL